MENDKIVEPTIVGTQKIECSVVDCAHNCIDDSTCRLNKIRVCPKSASNLVEDVNGSLCGSYHYIGDQNVVDITGMD